MSNTDTTKPVLNPDLLTPRDLARARDALPGVDVSAMLSDPIDMITLTIFCLRRRDDPEFTWDQALDTPMSEFSQPVPNVPPPTLPLDSSGRSGTTPNGSESKPTPPRHTTEPSSAPSTA
jgi:hypothetical protein